MYRLTTEDSKMLDVLVEHGITITRNSRNENVVSNNAAALIPYLLTRYAPDAEYTLNHIDGNEVNVDRSKEEQGWLCRDRNGKGFIMFTDSPLQRDEGMGIWLANADTRLIYIDNDMFPQVTWQSEPVRVSVEVNYSACSIIM